jgi:hypothetical protein
MSLTLRLISSVTLVLLNASLLASELRPTLILKTTEYAVIAAPDLNTVLLAASETQIQLTDHLVVETNINQPSFAINTKSDDVIMMHNVLVYEEHAVPYLSIRVVNRTPLEHGMRVSFKLFTNAPPLSLDNITVNIDGFEQQVKFEDPFDFVTYNTTTDITASALLLSEYVITDHLHLTHDVAAQRECSLAFEPPALYALCSSDVDRIESQQFYLGKQKIGEAGMVTIGDDIADGLTLAVRFTHTRRYYAVRTTESGPILQAIEKPKYAL